MIAVASARDVRRPQRVFAVVGLLVALSLPVASQALEFKRVTTIEDVGAAADALASQVLVLADVDHDTNLDLVTFDNNDAVVKIYLGDRSGGFSPATEVEVGESPVAVATADLLGRGRTDIVVLTDFGSVIVLLQGDEPLTFALFLVSAFNADFLPAAVAIADFSNPPDGLPDLAVLAEDDFEEQVVVEPLRNQGDGTFVPFATSEVRVGGFVPNSIVAGLFDGDGRADLAFTMLNEEDNGRLVQLVSSGDGTFTNRGALNVGVDSDPRTLVAADFNGDQKLDLATVDGNSDAANAFRLLLGNGTGSFSLQQTPDESSVEFFPNSLATADFDLDGHPDVVTTHGFESGVETLSMLLSRGPEHRLQRVEIRGLALRDDQQAVNSGDVNGDSRPDLVVLMDDGSVRVLLNVADDTPTPTATATGPPTATPTSTNTPSFTATTTSTETPRPPTATPPDSPTRTVTPQPDNTIVLVTPSSGSSGCDLSPSAGGSSFWPISLLLVALLGRRGKRPA